jgi:molybdopterin converting factor small subunit
MQITIHYLAQLRRAAGVAEETVLLDPGATLGRLVHELAQRHGEAFRAMLLDAAGQPQRTLLYAVGDEQASLDRPLRDGDVVTVLAPMAGGAACGREPQASAGF